MSLAPTESARPIDWDAVPSIEELQSMLASTIEKLDDVMDVKYASQEGVMLNIGDEVVARYSPGHGRVVGFRRYKDGDDIKWSALVSAGGALQEGSLESWEYCPKIDEGKNVSTAANEVPDSLIGSIRKRFGL